MFKFLLPLAFCFLAMAAKATIRTVSNNPATIAQFGTIQAAIDASSNGDTVYVSGSPFIYAEFTINNKSLTVIGPGFQPDKEFPFHATATRFIISGAGSGGTHISGMRFFGFDQRPVIADVSNIRISRNRFESSSAPSPTTFTFYSDNGYIFSNILFENNVFNGFTFRVESNSKALTNSLFRNNLFFFNTAYYNVGVIRGFTNSSNVTFDHNLIMGPSAEANKAYPLTGMLLFEENCRFLNLSNNIMIRFNASENNTGSMFYNNLTFDALNNAPWSTNGNLDGGGNLAGVDPQMAAQAAVYDGTFNPIADYTISEGPANNAGTDGKDIGLLYDETGPYNWNKARNSRLPRLTRLLLPNAVIEQGGNLEVNLKAVKAN